jgi:hypothetical protein
MYYEIIWVNILSLSKYAGYLEKKTADACVVLWTLIINLVQNLTTRKYCVVNKLIKVAVHISPKCLGESFESEVFFFLDFVEY